MWSPDVLAFVAAARSPGFADHLRALAAEPGATPWPHADSPELVGLERWGAALAALDRNAGVAAVAAAAQDGFGNVVERFGEDAEHMALRKTDECFDGAPVETQIELAVGWAAQQWRGRVEEAFDPSRQLNVWDEDLLPPPGDEWHWFTEAGQCCLAAILNGDDPLPDEQDGSYYEWPAGRCVARGLVVVARGQRTADADVDALIARIGAAAASAFAFPSA